MERKNIVIIGTSKTAEHVNKFIEEYDLYNILGFAVDSEYKKEDTFLGKSVYSIEELPNVIDKENDYVFIAMLWNHLNGDRRRMYDRLKAEGYKFANIVSPTAKVRGELSGDNIWIHDFVIVQNGARIMSDCMIMAFSLIGAHVVLGAHCFMGTKSTVAGGCTVGEQTFIGINSTIFDDRTVGSKCIVGACAAVKRDMPDFSSWKTGSDYSIKTYDESIIEDKLMFIKNQH